MYMHLSLKCLHISRSLYDCEIERNASNKTNIKELENRDYRAGSTSDSEKSAAIALATFENSVNENSDKTI